MAAAPSPVSIRAPTQGATSMLCFVRFIPFRFNPRSYARSDL